MDQFRNIESAHISAKIMDRPTTYSDSRDAASGAGLRNNSNSKHRKLKPTAESAAFS